MTEVTSQELLALLQSKSNAVRKALEKHTLVSNDLAFKIFPRGACGSTSELMGSLIAERAGLMGAYVCGTGHPEMEHQASHAWVEVGGLIVDLTYDQVPGVPLKGWDLRESVWHQKYEREACQGFVAADRWPMYPHAAYRAMAEAWPGQVTSKSNRDETGGVLEQSARN